MLCYAGNYIDYSKEKYKIEIEKLKHSIDSHSPADYDDLKLLNRISSKDENIMRCRNVIVFKYTGTNDSQSELDEGALSIVKKYSETCNTFLIHADSDPIKDLEGDTGIYFLSHMNDMDGKKSRFL